MSERRVTIDIGINSVLGNLSFGSRHLTLVLHDDGRVSWDRDASTLGPEEQR